MVSGAFLGDVKHSHHLETHHCFAPSSPKTCHGWLRCLQCSVPHTIILLIMYTNLSILITVGPPWSPVTGGCESQITYKHTPLFRALLTKHMSRVVAIFHSTLYPTNCRRPPPPLWNTCHTGGCELLGTQRVLHKPVPREQGCTQGAADPV